MTTRRKFLLIIPDLNKSTRIEYSTDVITSEMVSEINFNLGIATITNSYNQTFRVKIYRFQIPQDSTIEIAKMENGTNGNTDFLPKEFVICDINNNLPSLFTTTTPTTTSSQQKFPSLTKDEIKYLFKRIKSCQILESNLKK